MCEEKWKNDMNNHILEVNYQVLGKDIKYSDKQECILVRSSVPELGKRKVVATCILN